MRHLFKIKILFISPYKKRNRIKVTEHSWPPHGPSSFLRFGPTQSEQLKLENSACKNMHGCTNMENCVDICNTNSHFCTILMEGFQGIFTGQKQAGWIDDNMVVKSQGHCDLTKYVLSSKSRIHSVFVTKMNSKRREHNNGVMAVYLPRVKC